MTAQENFVDDLVSSYFYEVLKLNQDFITKLEEKFSQILGEESCFVAKSTAGNFVEGKTYKLDLDSMDIVFGQGGYPWIGVEYFQENEKKSKFANTSDALRAIMGE
jgi:hypothetical protein